jgi:hypothetical protein
VPCEYAKYKNRHIIFTFGDMICRLNGAPRAAGNFAMTQNPSPPSRPAPPAASAPPAERKPLSPAAQRALAEAEARRAAAQANAQPAAKEFQGPKGPEPTRYGDWENKGIASDF